MMTRMMSVSKERWCRETESRDGVMNEEGSGEGRGVSDQNTCISEGTAGEDTQKDRWNRE
jgi:hypothetical protein